MASVLKSILSKLVWALLGRRNMVRLGRFLSNEARLDVPNVMEENGELMVQRVVLEHAANPAVVFDVGANLGAWTIACVKQDASQKTKIYSFEPSSPTFKRLSDAVATLRNVSAVNKALSNHTGRAFLNVSGEFAGSNSLESSSAAVVGQEPVELITTDDFCGMNNIERIDLLKIDAEGHDMMVMEGARGMLSRKAIHVVQFEYNWRWVKPHRTLLDAFEFLQPLGYKLGKITPNAIEFYESWHPELEKYVEANYVACLPEWQQRFPRIEWWNQ